MSRELHTYKATVRRIIDGDTVDLSIDLGFHMTADIRVRLFGIDTPERGQPGFREATERLRVLTSIAGQNLRVETHKTGKFGRWLGELWDGDSSINQRMVDEGFAVEYGA